MEIDADKYNVLLDGDKYFWVDTVGFILGNCEAGAEEKYKFIIAMFAQRHRAD